MVVLSQSAGFSVGSSVWFFLSLESPSLAGRLEGEDFFGLKKEAGSSHSLSKIWQIRCSKIASIFAGSAIEISAEDTDRGKVMSACRTA
jgi:hypothetical protein